MKTINFSYSALVIIAGLVVSLAGCSQKRELDPRTEPELVRIVEVGSSSGADPAFTGVVSARVRERSWFPGSRKDHEALGRYGAVCPCRTTAHDD